MKLNLKNVDDDAGRTDTSGGSISFETPVINRQKERERDRRVVLFV